MKKLLIASIILITAGLHAKQITNPDKLAIALKKLKKETNSKQKANKKSNHGVVKTARRYLGVRYKYGASTKTTKRFDCSSFVKHVIKKAKGKTLPRTSRQQATVGKHINKNNLQVGDLVFFGTKKRIGHVGIFIGNGNFIHASSGAKKVTITSLDKKYYKQRYRGARRV